MDIALIGEQQAPVILDADVVVCGGGSAGLGAALAAAREGASVALVERWPFFGGNATAASLGAICGLYLAEDGGFNHLAGGIARDWADALAARGWGAGPIPYKETAVMTYVPWGYKRLADELVAAEPNLTPLLHSLISGVVRSGSSIEAVVLATKKGPRAVRGRLFVDATGDADVAVHAGCPYEHGEQGRLQYPSMQFLMQSVDLQTAISAGLAGLQERMQQELGAGRYGLTRSAGAVIPTLRPGEAVGAMTRVTAPDGSAPDGTDPFHLTHLEMEGRRIAEEAARFLVAEVPGFSSSYLQDTAVSIGIRETRHVLGQHLLTASEASACEAPTDTVAASAWPFEFHTEGPDTRWEFLPPGAWFGIPFRSLVAKGADNLLVAGRCISATHEALASLRVTGVCMAIGEAAGLAASRCAAQDLSPENLDGEALCADLRSRGVLRSG